MTSFVLHLHDAAFPVWHEYLPPPGIIDSLFVSVLQKVVKVILASWISGLKYLFQYRGMVQQFENVSSSIALDIDFMYNNYHQVIIFSNMMK